MSNDEPLPYGLARSVITRIVGVFSAVPEIDQVLLYGSRAKGNFRDGSDIDLVVRSSSLTHSQLLSLETQLDDLLLPYCIDLSLLHEISNNDLLEHIQRVGVVLYEKGA